MSLTRLRYFIAVAESQNIGRAARALNVAQPALSRQLKALEADVGAPLFERHARGVQLTPSGAALLSHAREVLKSADAGFAAARAAGATSNVVRVAAPDWPRRGEMVGDAVEALRQRHPEYEVRFTPTPWTISPKALRSGDIDVGFAVAPTAEHFSPDLEAVVWFDEPGSSALISARHPLAARSSVRLADLRDLPALIPPRGEVGTLAEQMLAVIRSGGYEPKVVESPLNYSAATQMAAMGAGWIIVLNSAAEVTPPGTVVIPIEDARIDLHLYVIRRADDQRPAVDALIEALLSRT